MHSGPLAGAGVFPAVCHPFPVPSLLEAVHQVGAVRIHVDVPVADADLLQGLPAGGQLHALVGGIALATVEGLGVVAGFQDGAPATDVLVELVAGTGAIAVDNDVFFI